jgi:hypothetical protein
MFIFDVQFGRVSVAFFDGENEYGWLWKKSEFENEFGVKLPDCYYAHYEDDHGIVFLDRNTVAEEKVIQNFVELVKNNEERIKTTILSNMDEERRRALEESARVQQEIGELKRRVQELEAVVLALSERDLREPTGQ